MRTRVFSLVSASILVLATLMPGPAQRARAAGIIFVTSLGDSGPGTLRAALQSASDGDDIQVAKAGTITLKALSGSLVIQHNLTIEPIPSLAALGPSKVKISGGGVTRVLSIDSGKTVSISHLTVMKGYVTASSSNAEGPGILNNGDLTLTNVVVTANKAYATGTGSSDGGAIFNGSGSLTINDSLITKNSAIRTTSASYAGSAGAISNSGTLTINNSTISKNVATNYGGGIVSNSGTTVALASVILSGNIAGGSTVAYSNGGGLLLYSDLGSPSTLTINGAFVDHNSSTSSSSVGGGVYVAQYATVNISNASITNNSSIFLGGGLHVDYGATANLTNVTFNGNSAGGQGGGINISSGGIADPTLNLNNVTVSNNTGGIGGGLSINTGGTVNFKNTLIANNTSTGVGPDCNDSYGGTFNSQDYNLIRDTTSCTITGTTAHNITGSDPLLGSLGFNGTSGTGATYSQALKTGSPALDAGDDGTCDGHDQRGKTRPQAAYLGATAHCDIGAFEDTPASITTLTFFSQASKDGWILALDSSNNAGGTLNTGSGTINIGDEVGDKQYLGLFSFATNTIPDNAVIYGARLQMQRALIVGDPSGFGNPVADIKAPYFGTGSGLSTADFQAPDDMDNAVSFGSPTLGGFYDTLASIGALPYISVTKTTQFKVHFGSATNGNNTKDVLAVFGGENSLSTNKPRLEVSFYTP